MRMRVAQLAGHESLIGLCKVCFTENLGFLNKRSCALHSVLQVGGREDISHFACG